MKEGAIWFNRPTSDAILAKHKNTLPALMGMEFVAVGDDFISGRIPVDESRARRTPAFRRTGS